MAEIAGHGIEFAKTKEHLVIFLRFKTENIVDFKLQYHFTKIKNPLSKICTKTFFRICIKISKTKFYYFGQNGNFKDFSRQFRQKRVLFVLRGRLKKKTFC